MQCITNQKYKKSVKFILAKTDFCNCQNQLCIEGYKNSNRKQKLYFYQSKNLKRVSENKRLK